MNREQLEALENEVNAEFESYASSIAGPITDGVVDIELYLTSFPKVLWILKEPVDDFENGVPSGGGWSMTKHVLAAGKFGNKPPFAPIAYVAYAVFNNYKKCAEIDYVTNNPDVKAAIKRIAYINVNKMPALPTSGGTNLVRIYQQNRLLLLKQIDGMWPDIIIGGNTLSLFFSDLHLDAGLFVKKGSASFCLKDARLYIQTYHPSQWSVNKDDYVDDIVTIIRDHCPGLKTST